MWRIAAAAGLVAVVMTVVAASAAAPFILNAGNLGSFTVPVNLALIPATIDIDPDTLNPGSEGNFVMAYIELPEGFSVLGSMSTVAGMGARFTGYVKTWSTPPSTVSVAAELERAARRISEVRPAPAAAIHPRIRHLYPGGAPRCPRRPFPFCSLPSTTNTATLAASAPRTSG